VAGDDVGGAGETVEHPTRAMAVTSAIAAPRARDGVRRGRAMAAL
jgi:hypothetical protein